MILKKLVMLSFVLLVAGMSAYAQSDITGKWSATITAPQGEMELIFNYKVDKGVVTGTIGNETGEIQLEHGKVDGKKFSYDFYFQDMVIKHAGQQMSENEIIVKSDRGEIKLTRVKK